MDILALKKEGHSIRAIAQMSGHSRNTIRRVLRGEHSCYGFNSDRTSSQTGVVGVCEGVGSWF